MDRYAHLKSWVGLVAAAVVLPLLLGAGRAAAPGLADHHWTFVGPERQREVELHVLVTNPTPAACAYRVRFTAEHRELSTPAPRPVGAPAAAAGQAPPAARPSTGIDHTGWTPTKSVELPGRTLAAGASEEAVEKLDANVLLPGNACRFTAAFVDEASGAVLAEVLVTPKKDRAAAWWLAAAALAAAGKGGGSGEKTGWGTMEGSHEARRAGAEWVEQGHGVIHVRGNDWSMTLDYTYDSQGPNASALTAVGKATGTAYFAHEGPKPVTITSATAAIANPGERQQSGDVVVRTGCTATGTFDGTMGKSRYRGVVTMTNGTQTLDLTDHTGTHRFDIEFTASEQ